MTKAGIMVEVHPCPESALSDSKQQHKPNEFNKLMNEIREILAFRDKLNMRMV